LEPILSGALFPRLTSLALRDCEWVDDLAVALSQAPILARIKSLDLSLGNLGDRGAFALAGAPAAARLDSIIITT
jgi:Leucine Rich repeat